MWLTPIASVFGGKLSEAQAGPPDEKTLFEIGSITKVFTTTLLAEMHVAGELTLNNRVNRYLPIEGRLVCRGGDQVTLMHLATHTSGLPRLPPNLTWKKLATDNPYADYSAEDLHAGLAKCRLKNRPGARTRYSNLGSGLLGHVLSRVAGGDYERLLIDRVLQPLGMHDTAIRLSDEQQMRMALGHAEGKPVRHWDFQVLAGASSAYCDLANRRFATFTRACNGDGDHEAPRSVGSLSPDDNRDGVPRCRRSMFRSGAEGTGQTQRTQSSQESRVRCRWPDADFQQLRRHD